MKETKYLLRGGLLGVVYLIATVWGGVILTGISSEFCAVAGSTANIWLSFLVDYGLLGNLWMDNILSAPCLNDALMLTIIGVPINFVIGALIGLLYKNSK